MEFPKFTYKNYDELWLHEYQAIHYFMEYNDKELITTLIRSNETLSPSMKEFIVDVVTGKTKRPKKRGGNFPRDFQIYREIIMLIGKDCNQTKPKQ